MHSPHVTTLLSTRFFGPPLPFGGILVASALCTVYWTVYTLGYASGESKVFVWSGYVIAALVAWWVWEDSRTTLYWPFMSYGFLVYFAWPITLPHYLIKTRGWKGFLLFILFGCSITAGTWGWTLGLVVGIAAGFWTGADAWEAWRELWNVSAWR